jgi:hypothetical protein
MGRKGAPMTEAQKEYIITGEGMDELDKYFSEHHDALIHIAWKNLKDKHVRSRQYNPDAVLDERMIAWS